MASPTDTSRPDTLVMDTWRGVLFASSKVLRVAELELIANEGFPLTWFDVLAQLHDAGDAGLRMQELQQRALFTRSGMTRLVDRMEAAGLVRRESVAGDRRGVRVLMTAEGRMRHDRSFVHHITIIEREFGGRVSEADQRVIAEALAGFWRSPSPGFDEDVGIRSLPRGPAPRPDAV